MPYFLVPLIRLVNNQASGPHPWWGGGGGGGRVSLTPFPPISPQKWLVNCRKDQYMSENAFKKPILPLVWTRMPHLESCFPKFPWGSTCTKTAYFTEWSSCLIDGTLALKALRVVLRQPGLRPTINSSPHIANHYMFGFNFITQLFTQISLSHIVSSLVRCCRRPVCKI